MFESYYQLTENPFRLSADESFRFAHKNYLKAWSHLSYALEQGEGFVMISGRPGSGKTTLIRDILSKLDKSKVLAINLVTNQLQAEELLRKVALEFGLPAESYNKATLLTRIQDHVEKEYQGGRRAVIVIDEAQNLTFNGLEELRLLSNLQTGSHPLFQIILVGQEELRSVILSPEMEHIRQRLVASCNIEPMNTEQTEGYIEHRLGIVGWHGDPGFDPAVFPLVHHLTGGVPRKINHVVGRLLLYGALEEIHNFSLDDVWIVAKELFDEERLSFKPGQSFEEYREAYSSPDQSDEHPDVISPAMVESPPEPSEDETPSAPAEVETAAVSQATEVTPEDIHASVTQEHPAEEDAGDYEEEDTAAFFPDSSIHAEDVSNSALTSRIEPQHTGYAFSDSAVTEVASFPEVTASGEEDITVRKRQNNEGFVDTTTNHTEEILNLPSMRAEKRKHDIEEQGGLINTSETLEASEMLSTGIGRSLRHIALIVALGSAIMAWYVMQPERFVEFKSRLQSWVDKTQSDQIVTTNAEQNPDVSNRESSAAQPGESTVIANQSEADEAENSRVQTVDSNPSVDLDQSPDRQDQARDENASPGQTTSTGDFIATQTKYEQSTVEQTPVQDFSDRAQKFQIFFNEGDENIPKQFDGMLNDLFIVLTLNKKTKLKIRGYTDPSEQPIEAMRDALARAQRVSKYFIDKGIKQARIQVESHSVLPKDLQNEPRILDEKLSEGRVELILNGG